MMKKLVIVLFFAVIILSLIFMVSAEKKCYYDGYMGPRLVYSSYLWGVGLTQYPNLPQSFIKYFYNWSIGKLKVVDSLGDSYYEICKEYQCQQGANNFCSELQDKYHSYPQFHVCPADGWIVLRNETINLPEGTSKLNATFLTIFYSNYWFSGNASYIIESEGKIWQYNAIVSYKTGYTSSWTGYFSGNINFDSPLGAGKKANLTIKIKTNSPYQCILYSLSSMGYSGVISQGPGTCAQQQGQVCQDNEECSGTIAPASDTNECCLGDCLLINTCQDSQRILRLSDKTNANAELWNKSNYPVEICYADIFHVLGSGNRTCSGTNKILGLNAETNALASVPAQDSSIDVCYGDLVCHSRTSCLADEKLIASLNAETNARLANNSDYSNKICCKEKNKLEQVYWSNMVAQEITQADLNDSVKMIARGNLINREINYTLYKVGGLFWFWDKKISQNSGTGYTIWRAGKKSDGSLESGNYYFKARLGSGEELQSAELLVSNTQNNQKPVAIILNPNNGEIYKKTSGINFLQASYDVDDAITTKWYFGDGINSTDYSLIHSYAENGQKNIVLEVKDERGLSDIDKASILICGGAVNAKCLFADIAKPGWRQAITGRLVEFNASSSYAIDYSSNAFSCLGGLCPASTSDDNTQIANTPNWQGFQQFAFNWTFFEKGDITKPSYFNNLGFNGAIFNKLFDTPASRENPHKARLKLSITD